MCLWCSEQCREGLTKRLRVNDKRGGERPSQRQYGVGIWVLGWAYVDSHFWYHLRIDALLTQQAYQ
jgi:hypothetical protein